MLEHKSFAYRWLTGGLGLLIATRVVPGLHYRGDVLQFILLALLFGLINALLKRLLTILTCPLVLLSLGFFLLVINALLLWLTGTLGQGLGIQFRVDSFGAAFWGGIVISLVSMVAAILLRDR
ncbi:MAG TPA: phage holin family protein [Acidobacteriota bacterium]|nr:phage holin family protein [Acidobacteriota bacterium]